jgi:hypothetical protein
MIQQWRTWRLNMRPWLTTLPLLFIAAMLVTIGAVKVGETTAGQLLLGAGLVLLGCWAGSELVRQPPDRHDDDSGG